MSRQTEALAYHNQCMEKVKNTPPPTGQKYLPGTRVWIVRDLGPYMTHFQAGVWGTVHHTYAHAYGGTDVQKYCIDIDGRGCVAWYHESQLRLEQEG